MAHAPLRVSPDDVCAWYAPIEVIDAPERRARALEWLGPNERTRFDRFHADADRFQFLLGRVMARALVGAAAGINPRAWEWREGPHGRPEIAAPPTGIQFNLAHSAGIVVCALARDRDVGVDVEDLGRRPVEPGVVARYCSPEEIAYVGATNDGWHKRFLTCWTLKEAYLKARGLGISVHLSDITFTMGEEPRIGFVNSLFGTDTRWCFHLARPTPRHLVALAAHAPAGRRPAFALQPFPEDLLDP